VYSPEIVDKSIIGAIRLVNKASGTIDYIKDGKLVFRTHPVERDRLVFQLGTADPALALQAALTVQEDVAAFDLNCGCPKRFSLQAGMGAALLKSPDLLIGILENLLMGTRRPVSTKIRLFLAEENAPYTFSDTHQLVKKIIETGVSALAIHARDPVERSDKHPAHWNLFRKLAQTVRETNESIFGFDSLKHATLILNGDIGLKEACSYDSKWSLKRILKESGATSVMSARAAQWNPLCLHKIKSDISGIECDSRFLNPLIQIDSKYSEIMTASASFDCIISASRRFLVFAQSTNNAFTNSKYILLQIWNNAASQALPANSYDPSASEARKLAREYAVKVQQARKSADFAEIFDIPWIEVKDENEFEELEE
jgi:tRNA-dihydrouridine synthase